MAVIHVGVLDMQVMLENSKTAQQKSKEAADDLLDLVAAGTYSSWVDISPQLVECYERAELHDMAKFVASHLD
jgi:hypothetical protein